MEPDEITSQLKIDRQTHYKLKMMSVKSQMPLYEMVKWLVDHEEETGQVARKIAAAKKQ